MPQPSPIFIFSAVSCVLASLTFSGCGKTEPAQSALNVPPPPGAATPSAPALPGVGGSAPASTASVASTGTDASTWVTSGPDDPATPARCGGFSFVKPAQWAWATPSMRFRQLQYSVPGTDGGGAAELIFSVFKQGDGGPVDMNIQRWVGQFRPTDGTDARVDQRTATIAGNKVTILELEGSYAGMGAAAPRPGWAQFGAIIEAPGRNVYIRLLGPSQTVLENASVFEEMVTTMKAD